jgi:hypothetical protein
MRGYQAQNTRSDKCNKGCRKGMQPECSAKNINNKTYQKSRKEQQPRGSVYRQNKDKKQVDIGIDITTELNIVT